MARYIDADKLKIWLLTISVVSENLYGMGFNRGLDRAETAIDMMPTADVAPKSEVAKEVLLELKKLIHDKAVYTNSQDVPNYVNLKVFDAVLNNFIKQYSEGDRGEQVSQ